MCIFSIALTLLREQADENVFEAVPHAFHAAETTGVATCVRKPLVATCSLDHNLCLWNAQDWCAARTSRIDCLGYQ